MNILNNISILLSVTVLFSCGNSQGYKSEGPLDGYNEFYPYENGYATVAIAKKYGFIDKNGRNVVPCKYSFVYSFHDGLSVVEMDDKYGVIDTTGREIILKNTKDLLEKNHIET